MRRLHQVRSATFLILLFLAMGCANDDDLILFSSSRQGNSDVYLMDHHGNILAQLTQSEAEEWSPVWINQEEISFLRQQGENITVHKLNIKTRIEQQIPHPQSCYLDDKNILYGLDSSLQLYQCDGDIFLSDLRSSETSNLTQQIAGTSLYPSWSPNFSSVIFTNNSSGSNDIYQVDIKTQSIVPLTDFDSNDERAELSPDGSSLVFSSNMYDRNNQDILIMNLADGSLQNITNSGGNELIARFSGSGEQLYFGSNKDGNWELYSYDLKSRSTKRLTNNDQFDGDPRICPR